MSDFSSLAAIGSDPRLSRSSACGGVVLWLELLRRSGAFRNLAVRVAGAQGWSDGQMMLTVLLRYVGTRRALPGVLGVGPDETAAQSGRPASRHHVYLTNLPYPGRCGEGAGLAMTASEVVRFAHERCGYGEEVHAVLKQDLAGGMLPSGKFGANAAWWQLAVLSANVNALLRHGAFGRDWLWTRMKQVRLSWVHLVAKAVRHARGRRLMFQTAHAQRVRQALDRMAVFLAYDTS